MIKIISFLTFLSFSSFAWATPQVTLGSGLVLKNCFYESSPQSVLCRDDKNPAKKIVVYQSQNGIVAFGNIEGSEVSTFEVTSIQDEGKIYYQGVAKGFSKESHLPDRYRILDNVELALNPDRLAKLNAIPSYSKSFSTGFASFSVSLLEETRREREEVLRKLASDPKIVELENGSTLTCRKVNEVPKSKAVVDREKIEMATLGCGLSECSKGFFSKEKSYLVTGQNPGQDYSQLLKIENGNFVDETGIKNIKNSKGEILHNRGTHFDKKLPPLFSPSELLPSNLSKSSDYFYSNMSGYGQQVAGPALSLCDPSALAELKVAHQNYQNKVKNAELVQYIGILNNQLTSGYIKNGITPNYSCRQDGVIYDIDAYKYSLKNKATQNDTSDKAISIEEAKKLFDEARAMEEIAWNYGNDGCYARAHLMAKKFEEKGIYTEKAWVKGNLEYQAPDAKISWNFHVAPVVLVKQADGKIGRYVIDPSVSSQPIPAEKWATNLAKQKTAKLERTEFPFPSNSMGYERVALAFTNSKPYSVDDDLEMTDFEKDHSATMTMRMYKGLKNASNGFADHPLDK